jgi:hypothetical protein
MRVIRGLLVQGNDKLAAGIWHFDLMPIRTCPGRSKKCSGVCYARRGHFHLPQVKERLDWSFEQSKRPDFAEKMIDELYRKGVLVMRWHVAGDIYSPAYARKMFEVMKDSPQCSFFFYTRSWRVEKIEPEIRAITFLPNVKVWYSADEETDVPANLPQEVRVAWMQAKMDDEPPEADLIFRVPSLRKMPLPLAVTVCPTETEAGKDRGTTCSTCGICWRQKPTL